MRSSTLRARTSTMMKNVTPMAAVSPQMMAEIFTEIKSFRSRPLMVLKTIVTVARMLKRGVQAAMVVWTIVEVARNVSKKKWSELTFEDALKILDVLTDGELDSALAASGKDEDSGANSDEEREGGGTSKLDDRDAADGVTPQVGNRFTPREREVARILNISFSDARRTIAILKAIN